MSRMVRRWVGMVSGVAVIAVTPFLVTTVAAPATSHADEVCPVGQVSVNDPTGWECQSGPCPPGSYDASGVCIPSLAPPPPPPVYVPPPVWRPNVSACVNVGRRISVSGCI